MKGEHVITKSEGEKVFFSFNKLPREAGPLLILFGLIMVFSIITPNFFSAANFINILFLVCIPLVLVVGAHFVIQTGSIDLSLEGVMAVSGVVTAMIVQNSLTSLNFGAFGILVGILVGAVFGLINGLIFVKGKIPSFIVTLGTSLAGIGLATIMYGGAPITVLDKGLQNTIIGRFLGLPSIFWWVLVFFIAMLIFERFSSLTTHIKAVGGNEIVAKQAGVPVMKVKVLAFVIAGGCYGFAAGLNTIRLMIGNSDTSSGLLFSTITAVIVGGTALTGGRGSIIGVTIGVFIMQVLGNGMILMSVNPYYQSLVVGIVLIVAITITINRKKFKFIK